ncbi:M23 family metallopeptidase [Sphingomonas hankyongi]|uniref:M23 family metallopeptidase n=1 Tax=Sphingomonas hankyongi TaxID=2908209 RepID=A0ABT0S3P5_9SPHN|nr:M23 family metallopeptidase [Sphingomonas hankyongi]MCL6730175.1 M23 family metallopeptidase [Sphingomonas hankyongi]
MGGKAAVLSIAGVSIANGERMRARVQRWRVPVVFAAAASAAIAISNAYALGPSTSNQAQLAPPASDPQPVQYLGAALDSPVAVQAQPDADAHAQRFTGRVGDDLTASLQKAGVPERQGREYVAILRRAIDLNNGLSVDDKFDLVIERDDEGQLARVLYIGLDRIARADVALLKWTDGKQVIWVNADGVGGENDASMRMPVSGQVTSRFGNRFHPILGHERFHKGVDLRAAAGTPIVAAADGKVVSAGWHGGYGNQVRVMHNGGLETTYGHMSRIAAWAGEAVRRGQVIGYVGSTGLSTGPHLHYEVLKNGRPVNPLGVKMASGPAQLEGAKLHAFHDELRKLLLLPSAG